MEDNVIMLEDQPSDLLPDDAPILPEGFGEGDDIFADPSTWKGNADVHTSEGESGTDNAEGEAPTTEQNAESEGDQGTEAEGQPTKQSEGTGSRKLKFQATIDHKIEDVEIDESELPTIYQKARNTDRAQERQRQGSARLGKMEKLSKALEYTDIDDFYKGTVENLVNQRKNELTAEGVHPAVAERMAKEDYAELLAGLNANPPASAPSEGARDFDAETQELLAKHPELNVNNPVPDEVILEAATPKGPSLLQAYENYLARKQASTRQSEKAELNALRKENKTLKQNADAASRAPVRSATQGGATNEMADDPFLKGMMSAAIW